MASSALVRLVAATVADLETLLAHDHVEQGREVMRALVTDIRLRPMPSNGQRQLEAVIQGDLSRVLYLTGTRTPQGGKQIRWLGIIKDLRTALLNDPLSVESMKSLLKAN